MFRIRVLTSPQSPRFRENSVGDLPLSGSHPWFELAGRERKVLGPKPGTDGTVVPVPTSEDKNVRVHQDQGQTCIQVVCDMGVFNGRNYANIQMARECDSTMLCWLSSSLSKRMNTYNQGYTDWSIISGYLEKLAKPEHEHQISD